MKILFLLAPSEGKKFGGKFDKEKLSFAFYKPSTVALNVSEKDLKCSGKRFLEATNLNKTLCDGSQEYFMESINRYSGVMYNFIDYQKMNNQGKTFLEDNFLILSGIYGIIKPLDIIGNYKLPAGKQDLYKFWWNIIPETIISLKPDYIINLLSINYAKLIGLGTDCNKHKKKRNKILESGIKIVNINFLKSDGKKISHGVKKIKGEWIKNICEKGITDYKKFGGDIVEIEKGIINLNITL